MGPCPLGPKEIDGLLVPSGRAYMLVNSFGLSLPRKSGSSQTIHAYKPLWLTWVAIFEALIGVICHDILILGKNPIK